VIIDNGRKNDEVFFFLMQRQADSRENREM
jgi:hypothetical protein